LFFQRCEKQIQYFIYTKRLVKQFLGSVWHRLCSSTSWIGDALFDDCAKRKEDPMGMTSSIGKYGWMKVVDIMTKDPLIVTPSETIAQADELMAVSKIRQLPVVKGGELVGIITDRDIRSFLGGSIFSASEARERALHTQIWQVMTTDPLTLSPDNELREAVELFVEEKVGGIPVVGKAEGLVGIVTNVDVLRCFLNRLQQE
jgi:CBS domain-containing protein